jgi:hypothetical protein
MRAVGGRATRSWSYACHEGNLGLRNALSAARADDGGR